MNYANNKERKRIITQALNARTLPEIEVAVQALRQWVQEHPDDLSAEDALEPLAMLRRGLQSEAEESPVAKAS